MTTDALDGLRDTVRSALSADLSHGVRAERARMVAEQIADLTDLARVSAGVIGIGGGSQVVAELQARSLDAAVNDPARRPPQVVQAEAYERVRAREVVDQLRASQLLADNPGIVPRPVDVGTGATGLSDGLPLIRLHALPREFTEGGAAPVTPGVIAGDINGALVVEGATAPVGSAVTIADVGVARLRKLGSVWTKLSRQVIDWRDPTATAMLDQALLDIADRRAEITIGADLIATVGVGTRVAGADLTTLAAALDAAEAAAGAAVNSALTTGTAPGLLIVNPANWPKIRRAIGTSWPADAPHPTVAVSIGAPAGTAILTGPGALHLFRQPVYFMTRTDPATIGEEIGVIRPFYLSVRVATGVQLITAIPA